MVYFLCRFICLNVFEEERLSFSNVKLTFFIIVEVNIFNKWVSLICNKILCTAWNYYFLNQFDGHLVKHLKGTLLTAREKW